MLQSILFNVLRKVCLLNFAGGLEHMICGRVLLVIPVAINELAISRFRNNMQKTIWSIQNWCNSHTFMRKGSEQDVLHGKKVSSLYYCRNGQKATNNLIGRTLLPASVATNRGGNERAINMCKEQDSSEQAFSQICLPKSWMMLGLRGSSRQILRLPHSLNITTFTFLT
jgi:hypothetical protein